MAWKRELLPVLYSVNWGDSKTGGCLIDRSQNHLKTHPHTRWLVLSSGTLAGALASPKPGSWAPKQASQENKAEVHGIFMSCLSNHGASLSSYSLPSGFRLCLGSFISFQWSPGLQLSGFMTTFCPSKVKGPMTSFHFVPSFFLSVPAVAFSVLISNPLHAVKASSQISLRKTLLHLGTSVRDILSMRWHPTILRKIFTCLKRFIKHHLKYVWGLNKDFQSWP